MTPGFPGDSCVRGPRTLTSVPLGSSLLCESTLSRVTCSTYLKNDADGFTPEVHQNLERQSVKTTGASGSGSDCLRKMDDMTPLPPAVQK